MRGFFFATANLSILILRVGALIHQQNQRFSRKTRAGHHLVVHSFASSRSSRWQDTSLVAMFYKPKSLVDADDDLTRGVVRATDAQAQWQDRRSGGAETRTWCMLFVTLVTGCCIMGPLFRDRCASSYYLTPFSHCSTDPSQLAKLVRDQNTCRWGLLCGELLM